MKKLLIFTAIVLFGFTNVNAQEEMQFGVKGGVNFATITGDNTDSFESRTCLNFGLVMELPISDVFSFQPELLYSCQGADYSEDLSEFDISITSKSTNSTDIGTYKIDYLNLPLMAKYYVAEGFSLEAGPQIGFLLSAKVEYDFAGESGEVDIKDDVKGIDFGVNFGFGYKFDGGLNLGARYNLGLSDANDDPDFDDTYKNSVIQVSVGYFF